LRLKLFRANCLEKGWEVKGPKALQQQERDDWGNGAGNAGGQRWRK